MDVWKSSWTYIKEYDGESRGVMIMMTKTITVISGPKKVLIL